MKTLTFIIFLGILSGCHNTSTKWDGFSCAINNSTIIHDTGSVSVYNAGKEYVVEKENGTTIQYMFSERPAICIMKRRGA